MIIPALLYILSIAMLAKVTALFRQGITGLCYLLFRSKKLGIMIYSLIYFPGTVIHEMSHFLFAAFLGVRTGAINLFPRNSEDNDRLELGSVQVAKTDFIRSSLIGGAPFITGSILLIYLISVIGWSNINSITQLLTSITGQVSDPIFWVRVYGVLAISNTLFTSKEDRRHWPVLIIMVCLIIGVLYMANIRLPTNQLVEQKIASLLFTNSVAFIFSIAINGVLLGIIHVLIYFVQKATRTKLIYH